MMSFLLDAYAIVKSDSSVHAETGNSGEELRYIDFRINVQIFQRDKMLQGGDSKVHLRHPLIFISEQVRLLCIWSLHP